MAFDVVYKSRCTVIILAIERVLNQLATYCPHLCLQKGFFRLDGKLSDPGVGQVGSSAHCCERWCCVAKVLSGVKVKG